MCCSHCSSTTTCCPHTRKDWWWGHTSWLSFLKHFRTAKQIKLKIKDQRCNKGSFFFSHSFLVSELAESWNEALLLFKPILSQRLEEVDWTILQIGDREIFSEHTIALCTYASSWLIRYANLIDSTSTNYIQNANTLSSRIRLLAVNSVWQLRRGVLQTVLRLCCAET